MLRHNYLQAEQFLLSREFFGMKLGLQNITEFLEILGNPQNQYATIHVAGTNGKGSTSAMLDAILRAQGYKVGLFTSPHLVDFRERIKVNGNKITKQTIISFVNRYRKILVKKKVSFFEVVTALAFNYFRDQGVDFAVIETGLGGRLDATNVLTPLLTITTDISFDHVEILGTTLRKIAIEKAGIIKPETPHLIGLLPPEAEKVIHRVCYKRKAPLYRLVKTDFKMSADKTKLDFSCDRLNIKSLSPSLTGIHQLKNSALVLKAVSILKEYYGIKITGTAVKEGLRNTCWPGRFQIIKNNGCPLLVLDVCHNKGGVEAFVESFQLRFPNRKAYIISGFVKRKEHQAMIDALTKIAREFYLVPLKTKRSADLGELLRDINWHQAKAKKYGSLKTAYLKVLKSARTDDIISIIGSHYLVGEFLEDYVWK